jgi:hypothetical protein
MCLEPLWWWSKKKNEKRLETCVSSPCSGRVRRKDRKKYPRRVCDVSW